MKQAGLGLSLLLATGVTLAADDIGVRTGTSQADLGQISEDLTAAFNFKALQPAAPLGVLGFHVNAFASYTETDDKDAWGRANGDRISYLPMVGVGIGKGLVADVDVGAFIADSPTTNVRVMGAELRYAIFDGGVAMPAVGLRASYTQVEGADNLDFSTRGLDLSVSKGFVVATPYAGIGKMWGKAEPGVAGLDDEDIYETKLYGGVKFNLLLVQLTAEAELTGDNLTYSLRTGFGF